jgi:DNA replication and repair protein RecF
MAVKDLRNIERAELELGPGLNVFMGRNAQGKTSLLEAVGLLARGRSFRTEATATLIRRGQAGLSASGVCQGDGGETRIEVEVNATGRRLRVDGRDLTPQRFQGRLDVVVYATDRLRVIRGPMRERRQFLDRGAAALWPAYRQALRDFERVVRQRNAALETGGRGLDAWNDRLIETGADLRQRRGTYVARLQTALERNRGHGGEAYAIRLAPQAPVASDVVARAQLAQEIEATRGAERRARLTLAGPHRDAVEISVDGQEAQTVASSGQARSALLALTLATLDLYREENGRPGIALLDDLDSELDEERTRGVCRDVAERSQALVTTAHPAWAERLDGLGRRFNVNAGAVAPA